LREKEGRVRGETDRKTDREERERERERERELPGILCTPEDIDTDSRKEGGEKRKTIGQRVRQAVGRHTNTSTNPNVIAPLTALCGRYGFCTGTERQLSVQGTVITLQR
jgi:hypothetical protein